MHQQPLTVAQLIKALSKLPQDLPVYVADWNEEYSPDYPLVDATIEKAYVSSYGPYPERLTLAGLGCSENPDNNVLKADD